MRVPKRNWMWCWWTDKTNMAPPRRRWRSSKLEIGEKSKNRLKWHVCRVLQKSRRGSKWKCMHCIVTVRFDLPRPLKKIRRSVSDLKMVFGCYYIFCFKKRWKIETKFTFFWNYRVKILITFSIPRKTQSNYFPRSSYKILWNGIRSTSNELVSEMYRQHNNHYKWVPWLIQEPRAHILTNF